MRALFFGVVIVVAGCARSRPLANVSALKIKLLTLPAESDAFPDLARAATSVLARATVAGVDEQATSKVSIEVVQLAIECVDSTAACYDAAAKSLAANKLLFAQIDVEDAKPKVSVTLFDGESKRPRTVEHTFATPAAAVAGLGGLVSEVTR